MPRHQTGQALMCSSYVELRGFEPLTSSMPWKRATNCAIAPFQLPPHEATHRRLVHLAADDKPARHLPHTSIGTMSHGIGIWLGTVLDHLFGDPIRHHPVAWFGTWAMRLEEHTYRDDVVSGAKHTVLALAPVALLGIGAEIATRRHPLAHTIVTGAAVWACLGGRSLSREGVVMADELDAADITAARDRLTHLCSRDPSELNTPELARGTTESLAENTSDAVVCSLFWTAVAGIPGVLMHRGVNTLDAMIGYRNERYERFGKFAARLDDVMAWIPARLAGAISCAVAPMVGGDPIAAWHTMTRDANNHPSPNGGWTEAAWAGALGTHLGGSSMYHGVTEYRPLLGDPGTPEPTTVTIRHAARMVTAVSLASTAAAGLAAGGIRLLRRTAKHHPGSR